MLRVIIKAMILAATCSKNLIRIPRNNLFFAFLVIFRPRYFCKSAILLLLTLHSPFRRLLLKAAYAQDNKSQSIPHSGRDITANLY
jgi:hypothetical protein